MMREGPPHLMASKSSCVSFLAQRTKFPASTRGVALPTCRSRYRAVGSVKPRVVSRLPPAAPPPRCSANTNARVSDHARWHMLSRQI